MYSDGTAPGACAGSEKALSWRGLTTVWIVLFDSCEELDRPLGGSTTRFVTGCVKSAIEVANFRRAIFHERTLPFSCADNNVVPSYERLNALTEPESAAGGSHLSSAVAWTGMDCTEESCKECWAELLR